MVLWNKSFYYFESGCEGTTWGNEIVVCVFTKNSNSNEIEAYSCFIVVGYDGKDKYRIILGLMKALGKIKIFLYCN